MSGFSKGLTEQLLTALKPRKLEEVPEGSRIHVHAAVSRFAVLYERIRNAVDYKDDHLLRKAAIDRILKRQFLLEQDPTAIATNLIRELIGARYLPNGEVSEKIIAETATRVQKYQALQSAKVGNGSHLAWVILMLAVEIEELIVDSTQEKALVTFLYERLADRIRVKGMTITETELHLQVYLACYRVFLKADDQVLSFKLLRAYQPDWLRPSEWAGDPHSFAERLVVTEKRIKESLAHPLTQKFQRVVKPWAVSLSVLRSALLDRPEDASSLLDKPESLRVVVERLSTRKYAEAKAKLRRGAVRATIYLFVTKMLLAFAIEVPLEYLWYKEVSVVALCINLLFPPVLMSLVGLMIRVPGKENTSSIQSNVESLLSSQGIPEREIRVTPRHGAVGVLLLELSYFFLFVIIFGTIATALIALRFTWVSAMIFVFFLCVVSFFAFRLRQNAREFVIVEEKQSLHSLFMDFASLPILRAGQFLSRNISRFNVFLFFFDFLFEAPFKIFLTVLEEWFAFIKEKKDEIQ